MTWQVSQHHQEPLNLLAEMQLLRTENAVLL